MAKLINATVAQKAIVFPEADFAQNTRSGLLRVCIKTVSLYNATRVVMISRKFVESIVLNVRTTRQR